jgi:outer membrane protein assembly factor BamB
VFLFFLMFKTLNLIFILIICACNCWSQAVDNAVKFEIVWQFEDESLSERQIILTEQGIIVSPSENKFTLLDADSGEVLWTLEITGEIIAEPFVAADYLYIPTSLPNNANILKKFSLKTGIQIGTGLIENLSGIDRQNKNASDNAITFTIQNNTVQKISRNKSIWKTKTGGNINDVLINKYGILISSSDNYLYQLNLKNGNKVWKIRFNNKVLGTNLLNENIGIVIVYAENKLHIFDTQKGKLISYFLLNKNESLYNKPVVKKDLIYLQTSNRIICLQIKK